MREPTGQTGAEARGGRLVATLAALPANRAFAYGMVLLIQLRAMWGIWNKDLTSGDTAAYFAHADRWVDGLQVNFAWSPLYTSFMGTVQWLTGDAVATIQIHRVLIVVALALLVLAVLRRLLPPWAALVGALWWASLPIVYDALYEIHIFALIPLMLMVWLMTDDPSLKRRGWAIGLLLASAIVVRQEAAFVAALLVLAMAVSLWHKRRQVGSLPWRRLAAAFGLPILVAAVAIGVAFERSAIKGETLSDTFDNKHKVNVCQVFTFSYQQRHPLQFAGSPWTECEALMSREFGEPKPTLTTAWRENPGAMVDFTTWNMRLLPQGVQVGLFNAAAGNLNPDYRSPRLGAWWAGLLSVLFAGLLLTGGILLRRDWERWQAHLHRQRWAWAALAAIALVVLAVVILTQRPRPSYMFGLSIGLIALAGLSGAVIARHFKLTRWFSAGAALLPAVLVVALPIHFDAPETPISDAYERVSRVVEPIATGAPPEGFVSSIEARPLCRYLHPNEPCNGHDYNQTLASSASAKELAARLDRQQATILYVEHHAEWTPALTEFLESPDGWKKAAEGETERGPWALLTRRQ